MRKSKASPVSVRDVAAAAGVSKSAASYALQNQPGVSQATRDRILRIARKLGYSRDARLSSWMAQVRETKTKTWLPIAWLNTDPNIPHSRDAKFMSPYYEGAHDRCHELGYRLDEIWTGQKGLSLSRISRTLNQRGIEGVIISHPARHVRLDFNHRVGVSLEGALLAPRLHRVMSNLSFNLVLALKSLKRLGHRRIGICLTEQIDRFSDHTLQAKIHFWLSGLPPAERVEPLFHPNALGEIKAPHVSAWLKKQRPNVVVCLDNRMVEWVTETGFHVPGEIGVVHLALDDDVLDWAGIYSNRRAIGRTATELVISLMQNRQFGLPETPGDTLIKGSWRPGRTLLS